MKIATALLALIILWLGGCATPVPRDGFPAVIVFKTPSLRYADQGFVFYDRRRVVAQIYMGGRAAFTLSAGRRICLDGRCMSQATFYRRFMGADYPEGTLRAVLLGRPIFEGKGLEKRKEGFTQRIKIPGRFDIIYASDGREVRFKDRLHGVLIKILKRNVQP